MRNQNNEIFSLDYGIAPLPRRPMV
jgi:hypothetical protein